MTPSSPFQQTLWRLAHCQNPAARDALRRAAGSSDPQARNAALGALLQRREPAAVEEALDLFATAPADSRDVLVAAAKRLRAAARRALLGEDPERCKNACRYAQYARDASLLPALVDAAVRPGHPFAVGLASTAAQVARALAEQVDAYARAPGGGAGSDPAFARRAALNALGRAVDRHGEHQRAELLEAFLLIVTPQDPVLRRILADETHAAHAVVFEALKTTHAPGGMDVLVASLYDDEAPAALRPIAMQRCDRPFVERLLLALGDPPSLRVVESLKALGSFTWLRPGAPLLAQLSGAAQAIVARLVFACRLSNDRRHDLCKDLLDRGAPEGRRGVCRVLGRLEHPDAGALVEQALADPDPTVAAEAVPLVRQANPLGGALRLVGLLDSPHQELREAARRELAALNLDAYRKLRSKLPEASRSAVGSLVGKADRRAAELLGADLDAPGVKRRMTTLELIEELGLEVELSGRLTLRLKDRDAGVRAESARLLGVARQAEAVEPLSRLLADPNPAVRAAATESLQQMGSLDLAQRLLSELEEEFAQ